MYSTFQSAPYGTELHRQDQDTKWDQKQTGLHLYLSCGKRYRFHIIFRSGLLLFRKMDRMFLAAGIRRQRIITRAVGKRAYSIGSITCWPHPRLQNSSAKIISVLSLVLSFSMIIFYYICRQNTATGRHLNIFFASLKILMQDNQQWFLDI